MRIRGEIEKYAYPGDFSIYEGRIGEYQKYR